MSTQCAMTDEQLADEIQSALLVVREALIRGDGARAAREQQRSTEMKIQLFENLASTLAWLIRHYESWVRPAGLTRADLLQEGYLTLDKSISAYQANRGTRVRTWMVGVWRNRFIDLGRRQRLELHEGMDEQLERQRLAPERQSCRAELNDLLDSARRGDPRRELKRLVFEKHHLHEFSMTELAREYSVSVSTIHRWVAQVARDCRLAGRRGNVA